MPDDYKNSSQPIERRISALLAAMTPEEKVGQMVMGAGSPECARQLIHKNFIGGYLHAMGEHLAEIQRCAEATRLGIPILFGIDAIHGHGLWKGATIFPTQLALSCAWSPEMLERVGRITAKEVRVTGPQWVFSPQLDIGRDIRWGRLGETFGEDVFLAGELGAALCRGYQGNDLRHLYSVAACAKHFAGYGDTVGGRDSTDSEVSRKKLLNDYLPVFERVLAEGCRTVMTGYQTVEGIPCTTHHWLLRDVLREQWKFDGFVVTDWDTVGRAVREQFVFQNVGEASAAAIRAGSEMSMVTEGFFEGVLAAWRKGEIDTDTVDAAVANLLRVKFEVGLFDDPKKRYPLPEREEIVYCSAHRKAAFEAVVASCVLLENNGILPLRTLPKKIAVVGPNADDLFAQLGGWSIGAPQGEFADPVQPRERVVTILDGLRSAFGSQSEILYAKGCNAMHGTDKVADFFLPHQPVGYLDEPEGGIGEAVRIAGESDLVVAVLGDTQSQVGEGNDRSDMRLGGDQEALVAALQKTGKPLILVLVVSKPHIIENIRGAASAILCAWNPGSEGGHAVAALLKGEINPSGKLTQSWPRSLGQQPVHYDQKPGWHATRFVSECAEPRYPFGHGLSYTSFAYSDLQTDKETYGADESIRVRVSVKNTGETAGDEIVQCYVRDVVRSELAPLKQLKGWAKISLAAGETQEVCISVPISSLGFYNCDGARVLEAGEFTIMVGPSSENGQLLSKTIAVTTAATHKTTEGNTL